MEPSIRAWSPQATKNADKDLSRTRGSGPILASITLIFAHERWMIRFNQYLVWLSWIIEEGSFLSVTGRFPLESPGLDIFPILGNQKKHLVSKHIILMVIRLPTSNICYERNMTPKELWILLLSIVHFKFYVFNFQLLELPFSHWIRKGFQSKTSNKFNDIFRILYDCKLSNCYRASSFANKKMERRHSSRSDRWNHVRGDIIGSFRCRNRWIFQPV